MLEQPAYSSPSRHAIGSPPDPDTQQLSSSIVSPGRAIRTQEAASSAAGAPASQTWELPADPYDAGLVNIDAGARTPEQQPSRTHEGSTLSHGAGRPQSIVAAPSAGSSRPAYQPMQQQQQQRQPTHGTAPAEEQSISPTQQPQQQQRLVPYSQAAHSQAAHSAPGGSVVRIQLAAGQPQRSSSSGGGAPTPTGAQRVWTRAAEPFSDLVHPDIGSKLSIHDRDLWSRHHRDGDL